MLNDFAEAFPAPHAALLDFAGTESCHLLASLDVGVRQREGEYQGEAGNLAELGA